MPLCLGIDTSNYTTSVAVCDGDFGCNKSKLLAVRSGTLGLRQSDALFQHVKRLPDLFAQLRERNLLSGIAAVAASTRPRAVEGSYMPCFLAGEGQGRVLADTLGVPFFPVSHQQGHIAAAAWSAGRTDLLDSTHLVWHLSGGTTELLRVEPEGVHLKAVCIGGTTDISAGQLIDRTGLLLHLDFPAGKALDALCENADKELYFSVKTQACAFSLSGVENKIQALVRAGESAGNIAVFALATIARAVCRATAQAQAQYPGLPVLCSGGVASNRMLREQMVDCCGAVFAAPQYSVDNAMGVAILARRNLENLENLERGMRV